MEVITSVHEHIICHIKAVVQHISKFSSVHSGAVMCMTLISAAWYVFLKHPQQ